MVGNLVAQSAAEHGARLPSQIEHIKQNFPIGSTVLLKSGSPALTVWHVRSNGIVDVEWFAGDELKRDGFGPDELVRV